MPKYIEIGIVPLLKAAFPRDTHYVNTRFSWQDGRGHEPSKVPLLSRLGKLLNDAKDSLTIPANSGVELVSVRARGPENSSFPGPHYFLKKLMGWGVHRLAFHLARKHGCKLVVIDRTDEMTIHPNDRWILDRCAIYFKRELPWSLWSALEYFKPRRICIGAASDVPKLQALVKKLRPLSLGIEDEVADLQIRCPEGSKRYDVFYLARSYDMERRLGIERELGEFEKAGLKVFRSDGPLNREDYLKVIAESRIAISPGGTAWDCFRHYEIPSCSTAMLLERPCHWMHSPPRDGIEAIYYDPHRSLLPVVLHWLSKPAELQSIAEGGRVWIEKEQTASAIGRSIAATLAVNENSTDTHPLFQA